MTDANAQNQSGAKPNQKDQEMSWIFAKSSILKKVIERSKYQIPANFRLHCLSPAVSHLVYNDYLDEPDEVKRNLMLELNWSRKQKLEKEIKLKKEETKR